MELWIRLDASSNIGFGHLVRMSALAKAAVAREWKVKLFTTSRVAVNLPPGIELTYIDGDKQLLNQSLINKPDWLFLDGYHFSQQQCGIFNRIANRLAHIDDLQQAYPLDSHLVVSPSGKDFKDFYSNTFPRATLLLGVRYVLLRSEFQQGFLSYPKRDIVLVSFGGADVANLSLDAVEALSNQGLSDIHLVVTDAMTIDLNSPKLAKVTLHQNLGAKEMASLMGKAQFAIAAAGSTIFELASQGVPSVFAIVADNQVKASREAEASGWCCAFDARGCSAQQKLVEQLTYLLASDLSQRHDLALKMVDVYGAERVISAMESITQSNGDIRQV
ncbi:PseG/SpsG family protein [Agarivorans sp. MS3-6]